MLNKSIINNCELLIKTKTELEKKIISAEVIKNSLEYKNIVKEFEPIVIRDNIILFR